MISSIKPELNLKDFASKDIYPNGKLKIFDKDNNLTEKAGVKTYTDLFSQLNLNNENLKQILQNLKTDEIKIMIEKLKESECFVFVKTNGEVKISKVKFVDSTDANAKGYEITDPQNPDTEYEFAMDSDIVDAMNRRVKIEQAKNLVVKIAKEIGNGIHVIFSYILMGLKYLSIAALQKGEEYTHALCIGTFHVAHYLFTKIGEFTLYVKDGLYYQIKKYIPSKSNVNESEVDKSFDSTIES